MTNVLLKRFLHDAQIRAFDPEHRKRLRHNIGRYHMAVDNGIQHYKELELAKKRAATTKHKAIQRLDHYLVEFEQAFRKNGGQVIWASTEREAQKAVLQILKKSKASVVVKQKTMISEELELNPLIEKHKRKVFETDLGEYIVQLAGEKPYHILTPAMHKSKEDVALLFHEKFQLQEDASPQQIAAFVREKLRIEFLRADIGITGANFLVADTGAVVLTENEGNGILCMAFPGVHIVIAGIEKIIPSMEDLDLYLPLLAVHGTGQHITVYNNIVFGPRKENESDGPDEMVVILLDNRRTEVLSHLPQRSALSCIRCGACLNGCPVYESVGGYTYGTVYSGPIGSVISPLMKGLRDYNHLSFASSLCGKCTAVCPVKIPLHELLLYNRKEAVNLSYTSFFWRRTIAGWKTIMMHRWMLDKPGPALKNSAIRFAGKRAWGSRRQLPRVAIRSFKTMWEEQRETE